MNTTFVPSVKKRQIMELAESGKRIDGRSLKDYRQLEIQVRLVEKAEGSAAVHLGGTYVIAGIKIQPEKPFSDTPDEGVMTVNSEFVSMASPEFEPGPPDIKSIELSRVVDRGLRESRVIETKKMCIHKGKLVWTTFIDIFVLDHCGNLIDASAYAALSALLNAKMPELESKDVKHEIASVLIEELTPQDGWKERDLTVAEERMISPERKKKPVPVRAIPVAVTMAKIGDKFFVDPSKEEEEVMDCRLTITFTEDGNICAIQKGEPGPLTPDEVLRAVEIAKTKSQELRKLLPIPEDVLKSIEKAKSKDKDKS
jgi:exosome complex component RRP42